MSIVSELIFSDKAARYGEVMTRDMIHHGIVFDYLLSEVGMAPRHFFKLSGRDVVSRTIEELNEERWLDLQTRAVFVELCLYNPNTNLFTFLRMGAEFPETGGNNVWRDLKTLRLYQHLGALGAYVFVCELLAMLFVLVFTVKAVLKVKAQKCAYFTDFWQVREQFHIYGDLSRCYCLCL